MSIFNRLSNFLRGNAKQKFSETNKNKTLAYEVKVNIPGSVLDDTQTEDKKDELSEEEKKWRDASAFQHKQLLKRTRMSKFMLRQIEQDASNHGRHDIASLYRKKRKRKL